MTNINIFITYYYILLLLKSTTSEANNNDAPRKKLVIDHDGGADDALAITMSLLYEKYFEGPNVVGLTTTHGNVNVSQVIINSDRILRLCGRENVPIYAGSAEPLIDGVASDYYFGDDGLGDEGYVPPGPVKVENVHSAVGLIQLSKTYEGELIVLAIGSLTNLALALKMDPDFISRLDHLYVGASHIYSDKFPDPEFNAHFDPEAYFIMAEKAKVDKVTIVPFSQIQQSLDIAKDWRLNVFGVIQTPIVQALNGYERKSLAISSSWHYLDTAVAAILLDPKVATEYKNTNNSIILCGESRAINTNNFTSEYPNMQVFFSGDVEHYKQMLINVYTAELKQNVI